MAEPMSDTRILQKPRKKTKKQKYWPHARHWDIGSAILFFGFTSKNQKNKSTDPMPDTGT